MGSLKFLIKKELLQFKRNSFLPKISFIFPVMIMLIVPHVANMEVRNVSVAFVDNDHSLVSQRMLSHMDASANFKVKMVTSDYSIARESLEDSKTDVIVSIDNGFEKSMASGVIPKIRVDANAVNATKGSLGSQYVMMTIATALSEVAAESGLTLSNASSQISVRYLFNETLNYKFYMIPAFIIILVLVICCFIPALNLVMEKEKGTIEQINVTPVSKTAFTLSKLIPYWVIGVIVVTEGILTAGLVYGLWPRGNVFAIYLASLLFAFCMSGFAITIANKSDTMQQCVFVAFFFVMIFMLMSGMLTPLRSMPEWAQYITTILPTRYFVYILRAVYLKGTTIGELWVDYAALAGFSVVFFGMAALSYKKQG